MEPEPIIEREAELGAIERFVGAAGDGPGALVLQGPAGIGKSTLLEAGVLAGRRLGWRVLEARPTEAEAGFDFAALADLIAPAFLDQRGRLPAPQERCLGAALLLIDPSGPTEPRAVATATLTLFRLLAAEQPLLIAVDDVQWLDPASVGVLEFLIRRLPGRTRWLLSVRQEAGDPLPLGLGRAPSMAVEAIGLSTLSLAGVQRLVTRRGDAPLPRPTLARLFATSGGNPWFALELARVIRGSGARVSSHDPLPLPAALHVLAAGRIAGLSAPARRAALLVAASLDPTVPGVAAAMPEAADVDAALAEAEAAEVLVRDGRRLAFSHPLLASAVFEASTAPERHQAHRRLASVATTMEERAVHLARTVVDTDAAVAPQIAEGARQAASRGALHEAAELFDAARRATPAEDVEGIVASLLGGASALVTAGEYAAARRPAEQALAVARTPTARAQTLQLLATMDWFEGTAETATRRIDAALAEVGDDDEAAAAIYARFVRFNFSHDIARAIAYADAATRRLDDGSKSVVLGHVLIDRFFAGALSGEAVSPTLLERGMTLEESAADSLTEGPQPVPLIWFHCADDLEAARRRYEWESPWYRERGNDVREADRVSHLAVAELRAGHLDTAVRLAAESCAAMDEREVRGPLAMVYEKRALVDAFRGAVPDARATLLPLIERFEREGQRWWSALSLSTLAFAEFTAGDDAAALGLLDRMREHAAAIGARDVLLDRSEPFEIDARLRQGDPAGAQAALDRLARRGRTLPRPWIDTVLPASTALVAAAAGDLLSALAAFDGSRVPAGPPFEGAWSRFVEGRVRRRARQKRAAAEALRASALGFDAIGAAPWAERARRELARVGLRRAPANELTVGERRIADLAASGLTNREIADGAFLSVKTVEANLARAYAKLGVRSRAELAARMAKETRGRPPQT